MYAISLSIWYYKPGIPRESGIPYSVYFSVLVIDLACRWLGGDTCNRLLYADKNSCAEWMNGFIWYIYGLRFKRKPWVKYNSTFMSLNFIVAFYIFHSCTVITGNYYSLRSEHQKAVLYFQRALKLNPHYLSAWTLMGHEFMEMKNTNAAIQSYRQALGWFF